MRSISNKVLPASVLALALTVVSCHSQIKEDRYSEEKLSAKGIKVAVTDDVTYWKIPLAQLAESDRKRVFDKTIDEFAVGLDEIYAEFDEKQIANPFDKDQTLTELFSEEYADLVDRLLKSKFNPEVNAELTYDVREMPSWQRYVIPQAVIFYFGIKVSGNAGIGAGGSATIMLVAQPWKVIGIDHTKSPAEKVSEEIKIDMDIMAVPNLNVGAGAGAGMPLRVGAGLAWGPIEDPSDLVGAGAGLSISGTLPVVGGASAKVIAVLKNPPLFYATAGYNAGAGLNIEGHGNVQMIVSLSELLEMIAGN